MKLRAACLCICGISVLSLAALLVAQEAPKSAPATPATAPQAPAGSQAPGASAVDGAAAMTPQAAPLPSETSLRERAAAHYKALGDRDYPAAAEYVAPDSRKEFFRQSFDALMAAKITDIKIEPSGDVAHISTMRTMNLPQLGLLDAGFTEDWRVVDGQWYLSIPDTSKPRVIDTPFGPMPVGGGSDPATMKKMIEERNKHVDPDQYLKALDKAAKLMQAQQGATPAATGQAGAKAGAAPASGSATSAKPGQKKNKKKPADAPAANSPATSSSQAATAPKS